MLNFQVYRNKNNGTFFECRTAEQYLLKLFVYQTGSLPHWITVSLSLHSGTMPMRMRHCQTFEKQTTPKKEQLLCQGIYTSGIVYVLHRYILHNHLKCFRITVKMWVRGCFRIWSVNLQHKFPKMLSIRQGCIYLFFQNPVYRNTLETTRKDSVPLPSLVWSFKLTSWMQ